MRRSDRILAWLHRLAQRIDRRLGEPVVKRPEPLEPVRRFTCRGCRKRFDGPGFIVPLVRDELRFCSEACAPPFLREGNEIPTLAGDPGG